MSRFHDRARRPERAANANPEWFDALYKRYPEIAGVLAGNPGDPPDVPAIPPMSIIISDRKGRLQFCISRQEGKDMWFGTIETPESILEAIDATIAMDELSHQERKPKSTSYKS